MFNIFRISLMLSFALIYHECISISHAAKYLYRDECKYDSYRSSICGVVSHNRMESIIQQNQSYIDNFSWHKCNADVLGNTIKNGETKSSFEKVCACIMLAGFENNVNININSTIHKLFKSCVFSYEHRYDRTDFALNSAINDFKSGNLEEKQKMTLYMLLYLLDINRYEDIKYSDDICNNYLQNCLGCWRVISLQSKFFTFLKHTYSFTSSMYRNECLVLNVRSKFNRPIPKSRFKYENIISDTIIQDRKSIVIPKNHNTTISVSVPENGTILQPHIGKFIESLVAISEMCLKHIEIQSKFTKLQYSTFNGIKNIEKIVLLAPIRTIERNAFKNCHIKEVEIKSNKVEVIESNIADEQCKISTLYIDALSNNAKICKQKNQISRIIIRSTGNADLKSIIEDENTLDKIYMIEDENIKRRPYKVNSLICI